MKAEETASLLAATPLLAGIERAELLTLAAEARQRIYPKGHVVFHEGDAGDTLFVLLSGTVRVTQTSADGGETVLATLSPPDAFGDLALVDGGHRTATVQTLESTRVLALGRSTLLGLVPAHPEVADALLRSVGRLVRRMLTQPGDLVFLDLPGRAAGVLVGMVRESGSTLDLKHVQAELAALVRGSRQSVNQILGLFFQMGHLELEGRTLVVKDLDALRARAEPGG